MDRAAIQPVGRRCRFALCGLMLLGLTGCVEKSVVIKVLADGSAVIHIRSFSMDVPFVAKEPKEHQVAKISEERIDALRDLVGTELTVLSNEQKRNARGWKGTELVLKCPDINALQLHPEALNSLMSIGSAPPSAEEDQESTDDKGGDPEELGQAIGLDINLTDDQLTIDILWDFPEVEPAPADRAQDPFAGSPPARNPLSDMVLAGIVRELRGGLFVETERKIVDSDASYPVKNGTLVTIASIDGSKLEINKLYELSGSTPRSVEDYKQLVDKLDGFSVEFKKRVTLQLE